MIGMMNVYLEGASAIVAQLPWVLVSKSGHCGAFRSCLRSDISVGSSLSLDGLNWDASKVAVEC